MVKDSKMRDCVPEDLQTSLGSRFGPKDYFGRSDGWWLDDSVNSLKGVGGRWSPVRKH